MGTAALAVEDDAMAQLQGPALKNWDVPSFFLSLSPDYNYLGSLTPQAAI